MHIVKPPFIVSNSQMNSLTGLIGLLLSISMPDMMITKGSIFMSLPHVGIAQVIVLTIFLVFIERQRCEGL